MQKIPTLFVRDEQDRRFVTEAVTPGCEWVMNGEGVPTRKWDGTCVMKDADGQWWARREVKSGKTPPANFEVSEHDATTGKTVGWEPAEQSSYAKHIAEAVSGIGDIPSGTYELVGPKVNGNPDGFARNTLVAHGVAEFPDMPRTFEGIRAAVLAAAPAEGIVFWRKRDDPDAGMVKIKRRDFRS